MKLRTLVPSILGSVTLLASLAAAAPAQAYVNWPGYLFDSGHSSVNSAATTITPGNDGALAPAWSAAFSPAGGFDASPVVYDGSIYIGGNNGVFYQLNEATGAVIHQITLGTEQACNETPQTSKYAYGVVDTATVAPDPARPGQSTVYVTGGNGTSSTGGIYLWALDAATLQPVWTTDPVTVDTEPGAVGWASPTVANGTISVGIASGCDYPLVQGGMSAFDQATGALDSSYKTVPTGALGGTIWATPASDGTSTWVATGNSDETAAASQQGDSFAIVRLQGGVTQDRYVVPSQSGTDNDFGASPTLFTGSIGGTQTSMIGDCNKNGIFYALQSQDLSAGPVWTYRLAPSGTGNLCNGGAIWDASANQLIMGSTKTVDGSPGSIQALSPDQNAARRVMWQSDLPCAVEGVPSEDGAGVLAVVTFSPCSTGATPSLYLYNAHATVTNGSGTPAPQLLDTISLGRSAFSQPAFADGDLFVATESNLMAYVPAAPSNTGRPSITGATTDGQTLHEVNGSWTSNPTSFTYQWQRCDFAGNNCNAIPGATGQTYTLTDTDLGDTIRVQESATNALGTGGPATSDATNVIQAAPAPPAPQPDQPVSPPPSLGGGTPPPLPSAGQIKAQLLRELFPTGKRTTIAAVLRHGGYTFSFASLAAGRLVIGWYAAPRSTSSGRATRPVLVATGQARLTAAGRLTITIKLTRTGRRMLTAAKRVRLTAKGAYTLTGGPAVSATRTFTLRR